MLLVDLIRLKSRRGLSLNILVLAGGGLGLELIKRGILLLPDLLVVDQAGRVRRAGEVDSQL